jgi:GxxExxY protein
MPPHRDLNSITEQIIGAAIEVHRALGPGLLESAYESCLAFELTARGLAIEQQRALPLTYQDVKLDCAYRLDLIVEQSVVVEIKAIDRFQPVHYAQVISYLKLSGCTVGLLINFHSAVLRDGIRRFVNGYRDPSASSASSAPLR